MAYTCWSRQLHSNVHSKGRIPCCPHHTVPHPDLQCNDDTSCLSILHLHLLSIGDDLDQPSCSTNNKRETTIFYSNVCGRVVQGDEWEEKWGEWWASLGRANKWAEKWAKDGTNVWHEKWGEEYDGQGGCVKYTDKVYWISHISVKTRSS